MNNPEIIILEFPWPDKILSPNKKSHWGPKYIANKKARENAFWITKEQVGIHLKCEKLKAHWVFHPPGNYHYDDDNLEGRMKSTRDGVSDALGINDRIWIATKEISEVVKPGKVILELRPVD